MHTLAPWFPQGWKHFLFGGIAIGLGVSLLFALTGLIGGISSTFSAVLSWLTSHPYFHRANLVSKRAWLMMYALGLLAGALLFTLTLGHAHAFITHVPLWQLFTGGLLAGFGARMSGGCTSGHGICGVASRQLPSLLAVLLFLTTAILTAHLVHALGGF
jgi:uncharacterized membrane protein YedE/YeeE